MYITPEDRVRHARRNTGFLCYESILVHRIEELKAAAKDLLDDVHRRYPGEELRCPYMKNLEAVIETGTKVN